MISENSKPSNDPSHDIMDYEFTSMADELDSDYNLAKEGSVCIVTETVVIIERGKPMIVHQEHAPEWLVDNQYILHGYRVDFVRKRDLVKSLFMKHNELLNIWTHLIGGIIFIGLVVYTIFYFDVFPTLYNKMIDLFSSENIKSLKNSVPAILSSIEYVSSHSVKLLKISNLAL